MSVLAQVVTLLLRTVREYDKLEDRLISSGYINYVVVKHSFDKIGCKCACTLGSYFNPPLLFLVTSFSCQKHERSILSLLFHPNS